MIVFTDELLYLKKTLCFILFQLIFLSHAVAQSNQSKAEKLSLQYLSQQKSNKLLIQNIKFKSVEILRSPFEETKTYKNLLRKVDSLKREGKYIDARIAKMKTSAELNQAKKDSYRLSKELTVASEQLIDFITSYKGQQMGWIIKAYNLTKRKHSNLQSTKKSFYLDKELTQVDSVQ